MDSVPPFQTVDRVLQSTCTLSAHLLTPVRSVARDLFSTVTPKLKEIPGLVPDP